MSSVTALVQALGLSYASGISLYATVAFVGIAERAGWIGELPGELGILAHPLVIGVAGLLALVETLALLVPWVATAWEAVHTAIRPLAAAALAALATWGNPDLRPVAAVLGGLVGLTTHATKLGLRATIDASPEPFTNAAATTAELGVVAALGWAIWRHPWLSLAAALALLVLLFLAVRALWRRVGRALAAVFRPASG